MALPQRPVRKKDLTHHKSDPRVQNRAGALAHADAVGPARQRAHKKVRHAIGGLLDYIRDRVNRGREWLPTEPSEAAQVDAGVLVDTPSELSCVRPHKKHK